MKQRFDGWSHEHNDGKYSKDCPKGHEEAIQAGHDQTENIMFTPDKIPPGQDQTNGKSQTHQHKSGPDEDENPSQKEWWRRSRTCKAVGNRKEKDPYHEIN